MFFSIFRIRTFFITLMREQCACYWSADAHRAGRGRPERTTRKYGIQCRRVTRQS
jgi:hypothetical protein